MKVKINNNNNDLWCLYFKNKIEIGERYIEVVEDCLDEEILKTYSCECLSMLVDEHMDEHGKEPEIIFGDE